MTTKGVLVAAILRLFHLFLPHYSRAECGTPLTLRIPNTRV